MSRRRDLDGARRFPVKGRRSLLRANVLGLSCKAATCRPGRILQQLEADRPATPRAFPNARRPRQLQAWVGRHRHEKHRGSELPHSRLELIVGATEFMKVRACGSARTVWLPNQAKEQICGADGRGPGRRCLGSSDSEDDGGPFGIGSRRVERGPDSERSNCLREPRVRDVGGKPEAG